MVWVETKYDGERAQIHVDFLPSGVPNITIFSKSKRDSTQDRAAIHSIILDALRLSGVKNGRIKNVILDAEMVAHNGERIDGTDSNTIQLIILTAFPRILENSQSH